MQYPVPQFTEVEDKIIGPMTLKQFLIMLGFGAIVFLFWSMFKLGVLFWVLGIPTAGAGVFVAFKKLNGRPLYYYLPPLINFISKPKTMVFKREVGTVSFGKQEIKEPEKPQPLTAEQAEGRLKKLAYTLDRKTEEEKQLLSTYEADLEKGWPETHPPEDLGTIAAETSEREVVKKTDKKAALMSAIKKITAPARVKARPQASIAELAQQKEEETEAEAPFKLVLKKTGRRSARKPLEPEDKRFDPSDILANYGQ